MYVRVFLGLAVLNDIAGVNHDIGPLTIDIGDAAPQIVRSVSADNLIRGPCQDMGIADLGDDHANATH